VTERALEFILSGRGLDGAVDLAELRTWLDQLQKALGEVDRDVTAGKPSLRFDIVNIEMSSPMCLALAPHPTDRKRDYTDAFLQKVASLYVYARAHGHVPLKFRSFQSLLTGSAWRTIAEVEFRAPSGETLQVREGQFVTDVPASQRAPGSATGHCLRLSFTDKSRRFVIYPRVGPSITCEYQIRHKADVAAAADRRVTVRGVFHYPIGKAYPDRCVVDSIAIHPDPGKLSPIESGYGSAPDCAGELPSEEFVRRDRNAWDRHAKG
jgi:hypothetical protein